MRKKTKAAIADWYAELTKREPKIIPAGVGFSASDVSARRGCSNKVAGTWLKRHLDEGRIRKIGERPNSTGRREVVYEMVTK